MIRADIAIVGAGMAGASLAAAIGDAASVVLIEGEGQPGYHATGRSAAFWTESYGGPAVQPLTTASLPFLAAPPAGFTETPLLAPRGAVHIADREGGAALAALEATFAGKQVRLERLDRPALATLLPGLRAGWDEGLAEPSTCDIDVAALHAGFLRAARRAGATLVCDAPLRAAERVGRRWSIVAGDRRVSAALLVDAAGAWADPVAVLAGAAPLGIRPYRRTMVQLRLTEPVPADLPLVLDARGRFYLKPLADGRLWLSPHDEVPSAPCDAAPEEVDIAAAVARLEVAFDWRVARVEHGWAGLRSFAPDRLPVYGFDRSVAGFFWCAGQGGFGIQTAPAAAAMTAALLLGRPESEVDPTPFAPARFA